MQVQSLCFSNLLIRGNFVESCCVVYLVSLFSVGKKVTLIIQIQKIQT